MNFSGCMEVYVYRERERDMSTQAHVSLRASYSRAISLFIKTVKQVIRLII